jgi:hypothetical protein
LKFSQGEVHDFSGEGHDFSGEVQNFSGEVQNNLRGGAHLPSKSGLGGGCKRAKIIVIILFQPYISTDFFPFT